MRRDDPCRDGAEGYLQPGGYNAIRTDGVCWKKR